MNEFKDRVALAQTASHALPAFKSDEGRARYLAAYDAALREWPVPYEELDLPTRLGPTHVIASGSPDAPPLVLLPSFAGSATVWRLNVEEPSRHYRTFRTRATSPPWPSPRTSTSGSSISCSGTPARRTRPFTRRLRPRTKPNDKRAQTSIGAQPVRGDTVGEETEGLETLR